MNLREDLRVEVKRLAAEGRFDSVLIESTGIGEPMPVAATFSFRDEQGFSLADVAGLDTMVTVVGRERQAHVVGHLRGAATVPSGSSSAAASDGATQRQDRDPEAAARASRGGIVIQPSAGLESAPRAQRAPC